MNNLACPTIVAIIDGRPIASRDIVEESAPIRVVIGNLPYVISFNISISLDHLVVLGLNFIILKLIGESEQSIISNKTLNPTSLLLPIEIQNLTKSRPSLYKDFEKTDRKMKCLSLQ